MDKYMSVNVDVTGIHDLSKEKMDTEELRRMTSEEYIMNHVGKVSEGKGESENE